MKIEDFTPDYGDENWIGASAMIPFVTRCGAIDFVTEESFSDEEKSAIAEVNRKLQANEDFTRTNQYAALKRGVNSVNRRIALDEEALVSMAIRKGLIRDYTEQLYNSNTTDIEQAMQELRQDQILEKYQYFVGDDKSSK